MRRLLPGALSLALLAAPVGAQSGPCNVPVPRYGDGLEFFDKLAVHYGRLDSAFSADLASRTARLAPDMLDRLDQYRRTADDAFDRIAAKQASANAARIVFAALGAYADFIDSGYSDNLPAAIQGLLCPITSSYLRFTMDQLEEHGRQMQVRYGPNSERLNILEMVLDQWMSRKLGAGELREPPRLEWILRAQVVGYQYDSRVGQLRPSSPTYQVGFSYYLYGTGSQLFNHIGIAGAYQRDLAVGGDLWGAVLHVRDYDIGLLCPKLNCKEYVVVASKNFAVVGGLWTKARKALNKDD